MEDGDARVVLGHRVNPWGDTGYEITISDRRQHLYLIGKSGSGKSTLLREIIAQDIEAGRGIAVIDPHGDLAASILQLVPTRRYRETIYFDPADLEYPIGINPLDRVTADRRHLVAGGIVDAFAAIWADSWGPRLEYILYNAVAVLLDADNTTLLGIPKLLSDKRYRTHIAERARDPLVRHFWQREFPGMGDRLRAEAISPLQNKIGRLLAAAPVRNVLGQIKTRIDFRFIIDRRRIFIANLSKGRLGTEPAALLGSLLLSEFQRAALERADIPEEQRDDFALVVDEVQNFATERLATMAAELRKYRLSIISCNQFLDQLRPSIRSALLGNVGTLGIFRVGQSDAEVLAGELDGELTAADLVSLPRGEMALRPICDGFPAVPFRCRVQPECRQQDRGGEELIRTCRERYGSSRRAVEGKIAKFLGMVRLPDSASLQAKSKGWRRPPQSQY